MKKISEMSYREIVNNIDKIKDKYDEVFLSFFVAEKIREWKDFIYSLKINDNQKNKLWEYLNEDIKKSDLLCHNQYTYKTTFEKEHKK